MRSIPAWVKCLRQKPVTLLLLGHLKGVGDMCIRSVGQKTVSNVVLSGYCSDEFHQNIAENIVSTVFFARRKHLLCITGINRVLYGKLGLVLHRKAYLLSRPLPRVRNQRGYPDDVSY